VTPKFSRGDRVMLSAKGRATLTKPNDRRFRFDPQRHGTVQQISRGGKGFGVIWDGRKYYDSLNGDFLEHADEIAEVA
jgi:hypothetical protein